MKTVCSRREAWKVRITLLKGPPLCHFASCAQLVPTCLIFHKVALNPLQTPQLISHPKFSAVDDAPSKHKRKRGDTAKGKDAQVKLGDHTEDQEVLLPLSRLQWDKNREHGQIRVLDQDLVQDKLTELHRNPPSAAKIRIIVGRDAVGQYWILSGQHIAEACRRISREYMNAHLEPPAWSVQFLAQVVRTDVSLHIRESIAGTSQVYRL